MSQTQNTIPNKITGGTITAAEFNSLKNQANSNATDAETRLFDNELNIQTLFGAQTAGGPTGERPPATDGIRIYYDTDEEQWFWSTGTEWLPLLSPQTTNISIASDGDSIQDKLDDLTFGQVLLIGPNPNTAYAGFSFNVDIDNITVQGLTNWNGSSYPAVISGNVSVLQGLRFRLQNLQINGTLTISNQGNNWVNDMWIGGVADFSGQTGFTQVYRSTFNSTVIGSAAALFIECSTPLVANLPTLALNGSYIYVNETGTWHYWKDTEWLDSGAFTWAEAVGQLKFKKYVVEVADSPYTMPEWNAIYEIHNDVGDIEVILPEATAHNVGFEAKFWIEHNPANHKLTITSPNTSTEINGVGADGANVSKAEFTRNHLNYFRTTAQAVGVNDVYLDEPDSVYSSSRYVTNFSSTSAFAPYSYIQFSNPVPTLLTDNGDWGFAVKIETPMSNYSYGQVLFCSNSFFIAYSGNGAFFMTNGTVNYYWELSPNTIVEGGEYIVFQYKASTNEYSGWVNGVKVMSSVNFGTIPPLTAPTEMWFGSNTGQTSGPSGYGYPLQECRVSKIATFTGNLTDADALLFAPSVFDPSALSFAGTATINGQWTPTSSNSIITDVGAVNAALVGADISNELL